MDINELESFKLSDAVRFHEELNPRIFNDGKMDPEVQQQLLAIAKDFISYLGVSLPKIEDITISGSNAAYSYTDSSDLDLHILVDMNQLPDDEVYRELFDAKKKLYNDEHQITVRGIPVELYVQDSNQEHISLGEYSVLKNDWVRYPTKRRANFDQTATRLKYEKLADLIDTALHTKDKEKLDKVLDIIRRYRQAGLSHGGEFGPENLAYKAARSQGAIKALYNLKNKLHSQRLSIDEYDMDEDYHPNAKPRGPEFPPTMPAGTIRVDVSDVYDWYKLGQHISDMEGLGKHDFGKGPPSTILSFGDEDLEHKYIDALKKTGLDTTDIDPKGHEPKKGQKVDPTYNVNEILDKQSVAQIQWGEDNRMQGDPSRNKYTFHTASARDKNDNILAYNFYHFPKYDLTSIEFSRRTKPYKDNFTLDNAGDQYTVFATLMEVITQYLNKDKPQYLMFGAKEPSRAKLYQTFVNRFASKFGYKQVSPANIPKDVSFILNQGDTPFLLQKIEPVKEASGYIPSEKEKNDSRFKTALTVDVKPDSIKKNAKAFGWKISRAGIPPLLRK